jgi:hypothetical protein
MRWVYRQSDGGDRPRIELCGFDRPQFRLQRCRRKSRNAAYVLENIGRGERI